MITLGSTARTKPLVNAGVCLLLLASIALFLHVSWVDPTDGASTTGSPRWTEWLGRSAQWNAASNGKATQVIEGYIAAYLDEQAAVNKTYFHVKHALNLDHSTYPEYLDYLGNVARTYMSSPAAVTDWERLVNARLSLRAPRDEDLPAWRKQVITTDKTPELPSIFGQWEKVMPDWKVRYFDDAGLERWVHDAFGGSRAEEIWLNLPRRVLQTDVFRYMMMLLEGGVYTDSDTAPVIPAERWGHPYQDFTPSSLSDLSNLLSTLDSAEMTIETSFKAAQAGRKAYSTGQVEANNEPSLVVSIEADAFKLGWDNWREVHMARAVQITQWTFLARPGHPVFLDALGRTLKRAEEVQTRSEQAKETGEEYMPPSALEWTGPGVFSDCVFTYLLARWGITPDDLVDHSDPVRIGDVLVLPSGSYSSASPFADQPQRDYAASWHGFYGRWRTDDPLEMAKYNGTY